MTSTYSPSHALETPSADPFDAAYMAAAGFLAGYSGTTLVGYKIDLRGWFEFCDRHPTYILAAFVAGASGGAR